MNSNSTLRSYYGWSIFGRYGFIILLAALALSILLGWEELTFVIVSCLIILLFSYLWAKWSLKSFILTESIPQREIFPDQEITIEYCLHNQKLLPVPWLHLVTEGVQRYIRKEPGEAKPDEEPAHKQEKSIYKIGWLSGSELAVLRQVITLHRRGIYKINVSQALSGDPFSLFSSELPLQGCTEVTVYPRLLDMVWPEFGVKSPNGNISDRNFVFTDPAYRTGLRDYLPSDSLRNINWAASARFQALKSNLPEGKAVAKCLIFLYWNKPELQDQPEEERNLAWELLLSSIASLIVHLSSQDKEWDFVTNVAVPTPNHQTGLQTGPQAPAATSPAQKIRRLLGHLAGADINHPLVDPFVVFQQTKAQAGLTLIIFAPEYNARLADTLPKLGKFRDIKWFVLKEPPPDADKVILLWPGWDQNPELKRQLCG